MGRFLPDLGIPPGSVLRIKQLLGASPLSATTEGSGRRKELSEGCDRAWTMPQLYPVLQDRCRISGKAASSLDVWMGQRQAQPPTYSQQKTHSGWSGRRREQGRRGVRDRNRECGGQRDRKEGWRGSSAVKNCTVLAENLNLVPSTLVWQLKTTRNSDSRGSCTLFWQPRVLHL